MGHLKERSLKDQMAKDPTEVIRKAVLRMLPRNKLRDVSSTASFFSLVKGLITSIQTFGVFFYFSTEFYFLLFTSLTSRPDDVEWTALESSIL